MRQSGLPSIVVTHPLTRYLHVGHRLNDFYKPAGFPLPVQNPNVQPHSPLPRRVIMSDTTHSDILQEVLALAGLSDSRQASQAKAFWEDEGRDSSIPCEFHADDAAVKTMLADDKINVTTDNISTLRYTLTALVGQEHESTLSTLIEAAVERFLQTREDAMEARLSSLAWERGYAPWTIRADPLIQILGTEKALTDTKIQNLPSVSTLEKGATSEKVSDELEFEIKLRLSDRYAQSRRELQHTIIWLRGRSQDDHDSSQSMVSRFLQVLTSGTRLRKARCKAHSGGWRVLEGTFTEV